MTTSIELEKESWVNKPKPEMTPLSQSAIDKLEDISRQLELKEAQSSRFLKINDGEEVEVWFDTDDPDTGMKMTDVLETDKTTGETKKVKKERMHFVVWNEKANRAQVWAPSDAWARKAIQGIKDFGQGLKIRRKGAKMDTDYTFLPTGFKRAM